jgi:hypothetical protein
MVKGEEMWVRIKSRDEFQEDGLWYKEYNRPPRWNDEGLMNYLYGEVVEVEKYANDDEKYRLTDDIRWVIYKDFIAEIIEKDETMTLQERIEKLEEELSKLKAECNKMNALKNMRLSMKQEKHIL